jgi:hypothetical protein
VLRPWAALRLGSFGQGWRQQQWPLGGHHTSGVAATTAETRLDEERVKAAAGERSGP